MFKRKEAGKSTAIHMIVTSTLFEAYLKCPTKCFLKSRGENDGRNLYANWMQADNETYVKKARAKLIDKFARNEFVRVSPDVRDLKTLYWRLAVELDVSARDFASSIDAVERLPANSQKRLFSLIPIRFICRNKITVDDKLLLGFNALVFSERLGRDLKCGRIIYGDRHATLKINVLSLSEKVRKLRAQAAALISRASPPDLILNKHCVECEFRFRCREKAIEKDDLSLMSRMSAKERKSFHSRGIFTITQLSYTFRPRRRPERASLRFDHALKALAIREQKIHIIGSPGMKFEGTPVYLDVEGLPDRDFYYLIGVRVEVASNIEQHGFWANSIEDEQHAWNDFLALLRSLDKPVLIHYGSYEKTFLKRMCKRHGGPDPHSAAGAALASPFNLLSILYGRVYFPTHSNGLKDCAKSLGFEWEVPEVSGAMAVVWRNRWENTHDPSAKESLQRYNMQDCEALQILTEFAGGLDRPTSEQDRPHTSVVDVQSLPRKSFFKFRKVDFQLPQLNVLNNAAYWNYQRDRVLVRSSPRLKVLARKGKTHAPYLIQVDYTVNCPAPTGCAKCGGRKLYKHRECTKTVLDVKFRAFGIERSITKYRFSLYRCPKCRAVFRDHQCAWTRGKFGNDLRAFSVYENIGRGIPQQRVGTFLNEVLGFKLRRAHINNLKASAAAYHEQTYEMLISKIATGRLVHADETRVNLKAGPGYVWAFTSLEDVVYMYSPSREGELVIRLLNEFRGVLVSDFYAAYNSINCPQQKCLIHLIRDLNDALIKQPFNDEMKELASDFAFLLQAIVATVDRFGLKTRFLRVHKKSVNRFFRRLSKRTYETEIALEFKTRLEKNRSNLFTFLDFDGVPWNNNNAEHAIKSVALLRRQFNGVATEKGIREYLILLSVCETCKFKGISFLEFLRSGERCIDSFAEFKQRSTQR